MNVIDLGVERRLRRLELTITRRLDGLLQGEHLGLLPGTGTEWDSGREYVPGDEVRRMDWALTARTTVPHVRDVVADRELSTWVLVDGTASMDFGTADLEKRDLAAAAVAAVGFLTLGGGNRLGAVVARGPAVRRFPARSGRAHPLGLLRTLLDAPRSPAGPSLSLEAAVAELRRVARRRGLVVVVSDFLSEDEWPAALRGLAVRHQVLAVEVADPRELELPDVGLITLVDPETGRRREVSTASRRLRQRFAEAAAAQRQGIRDGLRAAGAAHMTLRTDRDWVRDIARHVLTHRAMIRASPKSLGQRGGRPDHRGGGAA